MSNVPEPKRQVHTPDWHRIAATDTFRRLLAAKRRFVIPATLFFLVYYFALPILVGYFPQFMSQKVWGPLNIAYLFALSQFAMAWIVAAVYVRAAVKFDRLAEQARRDGESR